MGLIVNGGGDFSILGLKEVIKGDQILETIIRGHQTAHTELYNLVSISLVEVVLKL